MYKCLKPPCDELVNLSWPLVQCQLVKAPECNPVFLFLIFLMSLHCVRAIMQTFSTAASSNLTKIGGFHSEAVTGNNAFINDARADQDCSSKTCLRLFLRFSAADHFLSLQ